MQDYKKNRSTPREADSENLQMSGKMAVLIDIPQVAYRTWAIEIHTGDKMHDYELERELEKTLTQYPYSKDHDHVR